MFKRHMRLYAAACAVLTAGTLAVTGVAVASAAPVGHARAAASGTEHFQFMTTSPTSTTDSAVASGLFGDGGVIRKVNTNPSTVVLSRGTFKVVHSKGTGRPMFNPRTCVFTLNVTGTYRISHGTGKYAGISGHGTYHLNILAVSPRAHGKCVRNAKPLAFQQVIKATGPVHL
jgi:hypothetical protein